MTEEEEAINAKRDDRKMRNQTEDRQGTPEGVIMKRKGKHDPPPARRTTTCRREAMGRGPPEMMRQGKKVVGKMKAPEPCTHREQKDRGNENLVHTEGNPKETNQEELLDEKSGQ